MDEHGSIWADGLQYAAKSDIGLRRANNQDSLTAAPAGSEEAWLQRGHLFMVADGMGAHAAGELASKIATDVVPLSYQKLTDRPPADALLAAILDANHQIHSRGEADPEFRGMGTTCTSLVLLPQGALVAHVGDSRAYRLRGTRLEQLTFDHSLVWEIRRAGQISDEALAAYVSKNIITRSLGPNPTVQVDLEGPFPIAAGDAYLLCSDGLSGQVQDEEIGAILMCLPPAEAAQALIDLANLRGGPDNITAIVARVTALPSAGQAPTLPITTSFAPPAAPPASPLAWALAGLFAALGVVLGGAGYAWLQHARDDRALDVLAPEMGPLGKLSYFLPALLSLAAAAVSLAVAVSQRTRGTAVAEYPAARRLLGQGPYRSCDCRPTAEIADRLRSVVRELRDAASGDHWAIDWPPFNARFERATAAAEAADYTQALREYVSSMTFLLAQLKHQRRASGGVVEH